jgi:hypothetical protein
MKTSTTMLVTVLAVLSSHSYAGLGIIDFKDSKPTRGPALVIEDILPEGAIEVDIEPNEYSKLIWEVKDHPDVKPLDQVQVKIDGKEDVKEIIVEKIVELKEEVITKVDKKQSQNEKLQADYDELKNELEKIKVDYCTEKNRQDTTVAMMQKFQDQMFQTFLLMNVMNQVNNVNQAPTRSPFDYGISPLEQQLGLRNYSLQNMYGLGGLGNPYGSFLQNQNATQPIVNNYYYGNEINRNPATQMATDNNPYGLNYLDPTLMLPPMVRWNTQSINPLMPFPLF